MTSAPPLLAAGLAFAFGALALGVGCSPPASTQATAPTQSTAPAAGRPESGPLQPSATPRRPKVEEEEESRPRTTKPALKVDEDEGTRPKPTRKEEEEELRPGRKPPGGSN